MTFEFVKFPSLENHYREGSVHRTRELGLEKVQYLVTEKVHGANFSFHVKVEDGRALEVKAGKRTGFIEEDESFYGCRPVIDKYAESVKSFAEALLIFMQIKDAVVSIYGELYGGNVQSGMPYAKEKDFIAFDATVNGQPIQKLYLISLLERHSIPLVPLIALTDSLTEALELNESFTSKLLCEDFNGPEHHKEAEGLVIEPVIPAFLPCGSRVYFKKKTKRFLEKGGNKVPKPQVTLNEELQEILTEALEYVNESRYSSVVSKVGEVSIKDIGRLSGLMTQDILIDMQKDGVRDHERYGTAAEASKFKKALQQAVTNFIRPILLGSN